MSKSSDPDKGSPKKSASIPADKDVVPNAPLAEAPVVPAGPSVAENLPDGEATAGPAIYRTGTLKYTMAGLVSMLIWMLWGTFIFTLMESILPQVMPFLLKDLGASNELIQLLNKSIAYALTFFLSPVVSYSSDRHRGKRGRRMPYMLWSTPFVAVCLILIGYYRDLTHWLVGSDGTFFGAPLATMYIVVFAVLLVAFDLANIFVMDVYYYLFNDVVPEKFFTRFQAIFGIVGNAAGIAFSLFIFPIILEKWQVISGIDNFKLVMICVGVLYGVGFMVMCYKVKEGKYPPPPVEVDSRRGQIGPMERILGPLGRWSDGFVAKIKTYAKECFTHRYYWYFFLASTCLFMTYTIGTFVGLRNKYALGVDMKEIGWLAAASQAVSMIILYPAGWIADKFHPFRIYVVLFGIGLLSSVTQCIWIFFDFGHDWNLYLLLIFNLAFLPVTTVRELVSGPMYMRLLPKDRYGQFCSANGMIRAFAMIGGAWFTGWAMDVLEKGKYGIPSLGVFAYRLWPIWGLFWGGMSFMFTLLLYREWKKRGGVNSTPPGV